MTEKEFTDRLKTIVDKLWVDVTALVHEAQEQDGLTIETNKEVSWYGFGSAEDSIDSLACAAGWIDDRMRGINRLHKKSLTKKIRKALGYTYP